MDPNRPTPIDPDPVLSTTEVGELFQVHPSTVKRWCDRGDLHYGRTEGGHRRIPLSAVLDRARKEEVDLPILAFEKAAGMVWEATAAAVATDFGPTLGLAVRWLDEDRLDRLVDLFTHLGRDPRIDLLRLFDEGLRPFMKVVGERWERGEIGAGVEHQASETMATVLHRLRDSDRTDPPESGARKLALVGCAEGERHVLGARCVHVALEHVGWQVRFLGADVPMEEWTRLQRAYGARLVCISFSSMRGVADLLRCARRLAADYDPEHPYALVEGGAARVEGPPPRPDGPWPFTALEFFSTTQAFAAWLGEIPAGAS